MAPARGEGEITSKVARVKEAALQQGLAAAKENGTTEPIDSLGAVIWLV